MMIKTLKHVLSSCTLIMHQVKRVDTSCEENGQRTVAREITAYIITYIYLIYTYVGIHIYI